MGKTTIEDYLNKNDVIQDQIDDLIFHLMKTRKMSKITQVKLSQMSGVPQTTISRIESFSTVPTLQVLIKMANAMNLSLVFEKDR